MRKQGWGRFNTKSTGVAPGVKLGSWVSSCRSNRHLIPPWLCEELESIPGWSWNPLREERRRRLAVLREFVGRHGWAALRTSDRPGGGTVYEGVALGYWVSTCRHQREDIAKEIVAELEKIPSWSWRPVEEAREDKLARLRAYLETPLDRKRGPLTLEELEMLGEWVREKRLAYAEGRMARWLVAEIEMLPGWTW